MPVKDDSLEAGQRHRVDVGPVLSHLEVDVRPGGVAGRSGGPHDVATVDVLAVGDGPSREVAQGDDVGVAVDDATVDVDAGTAGLGVPVGGHSGDRGVLRCALARGEVDTLVPGSSAGHRVDAVAEGRGHLQTAGDRVTDVPVSQGVRGDGAGGNRWHRSRAGRGTVGGVDLRDASSGGGCVRIGLVELRLQIALSALQR